MAAEWVAVAKILRPHGVHGGMKVEILSDNPHRFRAGALLWLRGEEHRVTSVKQMHQFRILAVEGIETPEEVDLHRGEYLEIPRETLETLPASRFYCFELIGMRVEDEQGTAMAEVLDAHSLGTTDAIEIRLESGKTIQVPLIPDAVARIDRERRTVIVRRSMLEEMLE